MITFAIIVFLLQVGILVAINNLKRSTETKMAELDDKITALQSEVANDTTVIGSAVTLINGFSAQLAAAVAAAQAAGATPAQLQSLTDLGAVLKTNDDALAAAVAANTTAT